MLCTQPTPNHHPPAENRVGDGGSQNSSVQVLSDISRVEHSEHSKHFHAEFFMSSHAQEDINIVVE